jgi:WD40 repeat protein
MLALDDSPLESSGILVSFVNNAVGIYDHSKKKMLFMTESNHSETIFDMELNPLNKDILATSSFDGTIKIWNIVEMRLITTLTTIDIFKLNNYDNIRHHIYYGVSWSSSDKDLLASVNSQGVLRIWSYSKGKVLHEVNTNGKAIHRVAWSGRNPELIASGCTDEIW